MAVNVSDIVRQVLYILSIYVQSALLYYLPQYISWEDDFCLSNKAVKEKVFTQQNGVLCAAIVMLGLIINLTRGLVKDKDTGNRSSFFAQLIFKAYMIVHLFNKGFYNTLFVQFMLITDIVFSFVHNRLSRVVGLVMTVSMLSGLGYLLLFNFNFNPEFVAEIVRDQACDNGSNLYYLFCFVFCGYLTNFLNRTLGIN